MRYAHLPSLAFALATVAAASALLAEAARLPPRSAVFPATVLWALAAVGALWALRSGLAWWRGQRPQQTPNDSGLGFVVVAVVTLIGSVALLGMVGFYATAPITVLAFHLLHASAARRPWRPALVSGGALALATTGFAYLVFDLAIGLPAPAGLWR